MMIRDVKARSAVGAADEIAVHIIDDEIVESTPGQLRWTRELNEEIKAGSLKLQSLAAIRGDSGFPAAENKSLAPHNLPLASRIWLAASSAVRRLRVGKSKRAWGAERRA